MLCNNYELVWNRLFLSLLLILWAWAPGTLCQASGTQVLWGLGARRHGSPGEPGRWALSQVHPPPPRPPLASRPLLPILLVRVIQAIFPHKQNLLHSGYFALTGSHVDLSDIFASDMVLGLKVDSPAVNLCVSGMVSEGAQRWPTLQALGSKYPLHHNKASGFRRPQLPCCRPLHSTSAV